MCDIEISRANYAAVAENTFYNVSNLILITLGDEIGCGMIIEGKLFNGNMEHMIINYGGKECECGCKGCFSAYMANPNDENYVEYLASGVIDIVNLFQPNVLVLSGISEVTLTAMNEIVEREKYARHSYENTVIKLAKLDANEAVILGAAMIGDYL